MFNGKSTNFQGTDGFYYYMTPCFGNDNTKMPFNMVGKHRKWGNPKRKRTVLEYISVELFDNKYNARYMLYISQNWLKYSDATQLTYDYYTAKANGQLKTLSLGTTILGSIKITVKYAKPWYKFAIDFDDDISECLGTDLKFKIRGTHKLRSNGLWVVHALFVEPPKCDKCETCGLLGSFKYNDYTFAKCDGTTKTISAKYTYNEEHLGCLAPIIPSPNEPENDPIVSNPYCDKPANALKVLNECKRITNLNKECCQANIGGCDDFPTNCKVDVCEDLEFISDATFQGNVVPLVQEVLGELLTDICEDEGIIPVFKPTARPTLRPTVRPTDRPTIRPTIRPTDRPTDRPVSLNGQCLGRALTCNEIITTTPVWGFAAKGIDFTSVGYAKNIGTFTLAYIGCPTDGCDPHQFYCRTNSDGSLEFGTNAASNAHGALRALMSTATKPSAFPGSTPGQHIIGCASPYYPTRIHNAPVDHASVKQICKQLGYRDGYVINKINSNFCPEPEYKYNKWTTDFKFSDGFGRQFKCINPCRSSYHANAIENNIENQVNAASQPKFYRGSPTFRPIPGPGRWKTPTKRPTLRPTNAPTNVPTKSPVNENWSESNGNFGEGIDNNLMNNDDIDEDTIIDEIEYDLASQTQSNFISNNNKYVNMFIAGVILILVFTFGILMGSCKYDMNSKINHKYTSINLNASSSEYTTDDTFADENAKLNIQ